jgi:hypothetical protein
MRSKPKKDMDAKTCEIRNKSDYGPAAELAMAEKRASYFACETQVAWDVDLLGEDVIKSYEAAFSKGRTRRMDSCGEHVPTTCSGSQTPGVYCPSHVLSPGQAL